MALQFLVSVLTVVILYVIYKLFYNPNKGIWKNQGIPEVSANFLAALFKMSKKTLPEMQDALYKQHGRVYGTFQFGKPDLIVGDPELIKILLVKDFNSFSNRVNTDVFRTNIEIFDKQLSVLAGEDWKRVRSIVTPTFTSGKMKKMAYLIEDCVSSLFTNFESNQNKTLDMKEYFGAYTMDVIARCAFGIKLDSLNETTNPFVKHAINVFKPRLNYKLILFSLLPKFLTKNSKLEIFPEESMEFFASVTRKVIAERKLEKEKSYDDFLQLLIEASEKESSETNKTLSEIEIIAQSFIFFVAGYETTTNTLSFASYNLAMNPEVQKTLQREVDNAMEKHGDNNLHETIMTLPYLEAVISETLRFHTNVLRLDRIAVRDFTLNNIQIPKGTIIGIPSASIHKDKDFYPEPEQFKPERFLPENKDDIDPYTYLPFGIGPRSCVAMRFALMEVKYGLFRIVRDFEFVATDETRAGLKFSRYSILLQAEKIPIQVVKRNRKS